MSEHCAAGAPGKRQLVRIAITDGAGLRHGQHVVPGEGRVLLLPLLALWEDRDGQPFMRGFIDRHGAQNAPKIAEVQLRAIDGFGWSVCGLAGLPRKRGRISRHEKRMAGKTGRSDPCPCGSGRKFKRVCLGEDDRLI